jgi:hypothetical protein
MIDEDILRAGLATLVRDQPSVTDRVESVRTRVRRRNRHLVAGVALVAAAALGAAALVVPRLSDQGNHQVATNRSDVFLPWPARGEPAPERVSELMDLYAPTAGLKKDGTYGFPPALGRPHLLYAGQPWGPAGQQVVMVETLTGVPGGPPAPDPREDVRLLVGLASSAEAPLELYANVPAAAYRLPRGARSDVIGGTLGVVLQTVTGKAGNGLHYVGEPGATTHTRVLALLPPGRHRVGLRAGATRNGSGEPRVVTTDRGLVAEDLGAVLPPVLVTVDGNDETPAALRGSAEGQSLLPPPLVKPAGYTRLNEMSGGAEGVATFKIAGTGQVVLAGACVANESTTNSAELIVTATAGYEVAHASLPLPCDGATHLLEPVSVSPGTAALQVDGSGLTRVAVYAPNSDAAKLGAAGRGH